MALRDGPRPPDPSGAWQEEQDLAQTPRPSTRTGSAVPEPAPGTGGGDPAQAAAISKAAMTGKGWGGMTRGTILTPWVSIRSAPGCADLATSSMWALP